MRNVQSVGRVGDFTRLISQCPMLTWYFERPDGIAWQGPQQYTESDIYIRNSESRHGHAIAHCTIREEVGEVGMGVVYRP